MMGRSIVPGATLFLVSSFFGIIRKMALGEPGHMVPLIPERHPAVLGGIRLARTSLFAE